MKFQKKLGSMEKLIRYHSLGLTLVTSVKRKLYCLAMLRFHSNVITKLNASVVLYKQTIFIRAQTCMQYIRKEVYKKTVSHC